jgi:hypothetical protein
MKDKLALLFSYFLPYIVKQYATLDWLDRLPHGQMTIEDQNLKYKVVITKTKVNE